MITINSKEFITLGNKVGQIADLSLSGPYSHGGEAINTEQLFGIHSADAIMLDTAEGYRLVYDKENEKVKAFAPAPLVVIDEIHAIDPTTGLITLNYPAAYIQNVSMTGGQNLKMRSTGLAIADMSTSQCCLAALMAKGVQTSLRCSVGNDPDLMASLNGGFTGNADGWTLGAGWSYNANTAVRVAAAATDLSHDTFAPVAGKTYKINITYSAFTAGTLTITLGGAVSSARTTDDAAGGTTVYLTALDTTGLIITPNAACACVINTVYITLMEAKVTYVTQAWRDVWDNLVQDEAITLATGANNLANKVLAMMYVDQTEATAVGLTMVDEDDTAASNEVEVAFNVATAQLTCHADQNGKDAKVTYIKVPDSGFLKDRLVHNETATKAGGDPYTNTFDYPILLWGYAGCAPVNTGTTQVLIDFTATPEAGEGVLDWFNPGTRGAGAPATGSVIGVKSNVTLTGAYIWGSLDEVPNRQDLELPDGTELDITSIRAFVIGN